jgi:hypothetical protein
MNFTKIIFYLFIFIIIFIFIHISYYYYYYYYYYTENFDTNSRQKLWALSFGGGNQNYYNAVFRINQELNETKVFDNIIIYIDDDLKNDESFWKTHKDFIENNKRGYGYWIWKPYLIKTALEKMETNDILVYLDAGCEIERNETTHTKILELINKCNKYEILYTLTGHNEKMYTKMDLIEYMNMNNENVKNSTENQATIIFLKKNEKIVNFINEWYNIACNYHLLDDSPSISKNDSSFVEHRHDQSIFSLLTKTQKYNLSNENNIIDSYPFLLSRKRDG